MESLERRFAFDAASIQVESQQFDDEHVLVQVADRSEVHLKNALPASTQFEAISSDGWYRVRVQEGQNVTSLLQTIEGKNGILNASPDFRIFVTTTANDPSFSNTWGLENAADTDIDASQAWDYGTSTNTVVAVIDTGIDYNHVDLASNIWINTDEVAGNSVDDDGNGYVDDIRGWNFASNNNDPMDDNGHGTHVAGTIGAVGNNGIGIAGVAWGVKMMALKFLDGSGSGDLSDAIAAIDYARVNGAKVINASWGSSSFSTALQSAIKRFQDFGGIFVAAAGNDAENNASKPSFPANYSLSSVISVGASTSSGNLASFSNYGTNVDIAAPGSNIYSTMPGNRYASLSGTSMAAPHVAGAISLLWGQTPTSSAAQLIDLVMKNTDSVLLDRVASGRLNLGKAMTALRGGSFPINPSKPYVTAANWVGNSTSLSSVDVTFSKAMNPGSVVAQSVQLVAPDGSAITPTSTQAIGTGNTQFRIGFASQSTVGTYALKILPTVTDSSGNFLDQDRDGNAGENLEDIFTSSAQIQTLQQITVSGPIAIADASLFRSRSTNIPIIVNDSLTVGDLNLEVSIDHAYVGDLRVRLRSPDGTWVTLVQRRGGSSDNLRVTFDDEATSSIATPRSQLLGAHRPERSLSAFDGKAAKGAWLLEVTDNAYLDTGTFQRAALQIAPRNSVAALETPNADDVVDVNSEIENWRGRSRNRR
jgi:serine protease